jgi:hypothetical protein
VVKEQTPHRVQCRSSKKSHFKNRRKSIAGGLMLRGLESHSCGTLWVDSES